jgi:hypothetical protein
MWRDGVIPVAMEKVPNHGYRIFLLVGEFDFCGVEVGVEFAADGQSSLIPTGRSN